MAKASKSSKLAIAIMAGKAPAPLAKPTSKKTTPAKKAAGKKNTPTKAMKSTGSIMASMKPSKKGC